MRVAAGYHGNSSGQLWQDTFTAIVNTTEPQQMVLFQRINRPASKYVHDTSTIVYTNVPPY